MLLIIEFRPGVTAESVNNTVDSSLHILTLTSVHFFVNHFAAILLICFCINNTITDNCYTQPLVTHITGCGKTVKDPHNPQQGILRICSGLCR